MKKELPGYLRYCFLDVVADQPRMKAVMMDMSGYADGIVKPGHKSPFLGAAYAHRFLKRTHKQFNVAASAGGYFENRAKLWQGSYLEHDNAYHLAIDINLPAGTPMTLRYPGRVVKVAKHSWDVGGWGNIAVFKFLEPVGEISHILYGHMAPMPHLKTGMILRPGDTIGVLGTESQNGGWFEHSHMQAFSEFGWKLSGHADIEDEKQFDGYGFNTRALRRAFPNPMPAIGSFSRTPAIKL